MRRLIFIYCLVAGCCDLLTGVLLVAHPAATLGLMGIASVPVEPIFLRWIGVFVASIGFFYLYPWMIDPAGRAMRLRVVLEATALARVAVAAFVLSSILSGALALAWASVAATDFTLAVVQVVLLRRWSE